MSTIGTTLTQQAIRSLQAGDRSGALAALSQIITLSPELGRSWGAVAHLAGEIGAASIAIAASSRLAEAFPDSLNGQLVHGQTLARNGRAKEAAALGDRLTRAFPDQAAAWHFAGICHAELGDRTAASDALRRAIKLMNGAGDGWTWLALAGLKTFSAGDPDIAAIQKGVASLQTAKEATQADAALFFALGKALDDVGEVEAAFAAYAEGARRFQSLRPAPQDDAPLVRDILENFSKPEIEALSVKTDGATARPIFVLGMPRSGTTLVEQILCAHSAVRDGGELGLFGAAARPIGAMTMPRLKAFLNARPGGLEAIRDAYLAMLEERFGPAAATEPHVVDKTLGHVMYLGVIRMAFPQARFIWLRREPGAVAWSCYRTAFARGMDWSWSLEGIARRMQTDDRLHAHWSVVLGDAMLTVPYEDLVRSPEDWIGKIVDHVGLGAEADLSDTSRSARAVTTASSAQVRRPIHTESITSWRRYQDKLKPFFDAYEKV